MADLRYHPVHRDAASLSAAAQPASVVIVGDHIPMGLERFGEVHVVLAPEVSLPSGVYTFREDNGVSMLVVLVGASPGAPVTAEWSAGDDEPLIRAYDWMCTWRDSAPKVSYPLFGEGEQVLVTPDHQEGVVRNRSYEVDIAEWFYDVRMDGRTQSLRERVLVRPDVDDDPYEWIARDVGSADRLAASLTRTKLREQLTDTVYSFRASRTIFRPYQFRPVLRLLQASSMRLLIADEVGLGKTIEAGLIWTELDARRLADRVLVVSPSMLVPKWKLEMEERFGFELDELDRSGLDDLLERVESDRVPHRLHVITSVERLRAWSGLGRMAELTPRFDLIVVDEAHVFRNSGTRSNALGALLADWADALVFLTATPLNLGNRDLYNLLELLAPGEFDDRQVLEQRLEPNAVLHRVSSSLLDREVTSADRIAWLDELNYMPFGIAVKRRPEFADLERIVGQPTLSAADVADAKRLTSRLHALSSVVTRTRKVEVQEEKAMRDAYPIPVEWTADESALYFAIQQWQYERATRLGMPVGFVTQMPLRLASSCLPAARDRILDAAGGWFDREVDDSFDSFDDIDDEARPELSDSELDDIGVPPEVVVRAAERLGDVDTKFDRFIEMILPIITQQKKRVLLFTFSRNALAYLHRRMAPLVRCAVMHGDVDKDERHSIMRRFRDHEFDILLASRVASEGLDFEFCSVVVNYDLPWNPMEVEQRIGRIDRFGQTEEKILIVNFHTPGTIESDIIARVHDRIGVFKDSIGELEPILQSTFADLRRTMFDFELTEEQRRLKLDQMLAAIEEQRLTLNDLESASPMLISADQAEIDGLERDLVENGRYVGQHELVLLLKEWVSKSPGAECVVDETRTWLHVHGNAGLVADVEALVGAGERSALELESIGRKLRYEQAISLCLDQETARITGADLLNTNHPLVRAAAHAGAHNRVRFASAALTDDAVQPGRYLVLVGLARWSGLQASAEMWTTAVDLATGQEAPPVGSALLANLAEAQLEPTDATSVDATTLRRAISWMRQRQLAEETRRTAENEALIEIRRISIRETFDRKNAQIRRRISTARANGSQVAIRLGESHLASQERLQREEERQLDARLVGSMELEYLAVCLTEVLT